MYDNTPSHIEVVLANSAQGFELLGAVVVDADGQLMAAFFVQGLDEQTRRAPLAIADRLLNHVAAGRAVTDLNFGILYDLDGRCLAYGPVVIRHIPHLLILVAPPEVNVAQAFDHMAGQVEKI